MIVLNDEVEGNWDCEDFGMKVKEIGIELG